VRILHAGLYHGLPFSFNIHPNADEHTIEAWIQSNLCRCTSYDEIKSAIQSQIGQ
jgi:aerobic-type carbon monoxide dehydrogenase small subunit (CoxS/CutS family)